MHVEGMLAGIDTNKRNVLHDGLLHKETPCQRTAHRVVGTISLTAISQKWRFYFYQPVDIRLYRRERQITGRSVR